MREIQVDLEAIAENYKTLKRLVPGQVMAIVKANAFGHGAIEVARKLDSIGVDYLGTADLEEAIVLREAGVKAKLFAWLHGSHTDFAHGLNENIEIGLSTVLGLEKVAEAAKLSGKKAIVHLKIDTGLGRSGAVPSDWPDVISKALQLRELGLIELKGVFSHLSGTSEEDDLEQIRVFEEQIEIAKKLGASFELRHIAASLGTLRYASARFDAVRVGLALYGHDPNPTTKALDYGLKPAMRVVSEVVQLKRVPKGHGVSYGYLYRTPKETTLALVPFGYAEGLPRIATGKAEVMLRGKRYLIQARIAMDQFVLDIGDDECEVGDEVIIIGDGSKGEPTAEELAIAAGTINYEIVTRLGGRARRVYR